MKNLFKALLILAPFTILNSLGQIKARNEFIVHYSDLHSFKAVVYLTGRPRSISGVKIVSYGWRQVEGRVAMLEFPTGRLTKVRFPGVGEYGFEFHVVDSFGLKGADTVYVKVIN